MICWHTWFSGVVPSKERSSPEQVWLWHSERYLVSCSSISYSQLSWHLIYTRTSKLHNWTVWCSVWTVYCEVLKYIVQMCFLASQFMLGITVSDWLVNAPIRFIEIPVDMGLQILLTAAFQQVPAPPRNRVWTLSTGQSFSGTTHERFGLRTI